MLVELKNGETLNGHLINCDTWMNLTLKEVVQTSPEGDKFFRVPEVYVRGNNVCIFTSATYICKRLIGARSNIYAFRMKSSTYLRISNKTSHPVEVVVGAFSEATTVVEETGEEAEAGEELVAGAGEGDEGCRVRCSGHRILS